MQLILFLTGLAVGLGLWMWQKLQTERYLGKVPKNFAPRSSGGELPLIHQLQHKITVLEQQKLGLQQQLHDYQQLLDLAPIAYLHVDEDNQLLLCNHHAKQMLSLQRWQSGKLRLLLELVRSYELDRLIEQTRKRQEFQSAEWVYHPSCDHDATGVNMESLAIRGYSFPLVNGEVAVFLENRQPLLDVHKARDRAFSDLAHELRTPLTSIRLVVETLQDRLDAPFNRLVNRLLQEVDRLIDLVQRWLELTQLETNASITLHRQPVELRSLILSVWETLEPLAKRRQIHISDTNCEEVWINVDSSQMYQVFLNLLDNAIKYTPDGGTIHINTETMIKNNQPLLGVNIIDSGKGFADKDLPNVFERFYRGDESRVRLQEKAGNGNTLIAGSGLGLAIVRQIVLAHEGFIQAMNDPQTGGAKLRILLPQNEVANHLS
ncbi:PAS domain-containing sensor histidine kinase [Calothrix rhizosoleniae]|uniref:PAS domain-containing sensor histidine kinase n=1 Tax=Calothrix rhizosoleniae TaxID=888997 RepID=UPI000B497945|nr:PAS domain-containing sensor histidine kinase [Calothrix rhizosoleniae]